MTQEDINQWEKDHQQDIKGWEKDFETNEVTFTMTDGTKVKLTIEES